MASQFNGRNGTESLLCDVIAVLNVAAFRRQWVVHWEGFGSKSKFYFTWEVAEEFARCSEGIIGLCFIVCLSNCGLATCHSEVTNRRYRVFFNFNVSRRGLKESPKKLLTVQFRSKLSSVKSSAQTRECCGG